VTAIDPRKLETFRVVVQAGKISHAAKLLHLSQPAVTAQIRALEEACGRALLQRGPRGVKPNRWGERLLQAARQVHEVLAEAETDLGTDSAVEGDVVLGASMTGAAYLLPPLVAGFRTLHGPVPFRVQVANTARVLEWVAEGRVPLAVVEMQGRSPRVHLERFVEDPLVAVVAPADAGFRGIARAADLASRTLLVREPGSGTRAIVEGALAKVLGSKQVARAELQFGSNQSVKLAAVAGLGVAFVSRWSVQLEVGAGLLRILPLRDLRLVRHFYFATASREVHGPAGRFLAWARRNPPAPG
jgi:DNA-binding transcriptional LysR family regulator